MTKLKKPVSRAMQALALKVDPVAYVSPALLPGEDREVVIARAPQSAEEQLERAAQADPVGFLTAVMQGQPISTFSVEDGKSAVGYYNPTMIERERVAMFLAELVTKRAKRPSSSTPSEGGVEEDAPVQDGYAAMAARRAADGA